MKRILGVSLTLFIFLLLVACGGEEENTATLRMEEEGLVIEMTYIAEGDIVKTQTADNTITYEAMGVSTPEEAEAILGDMVEQYQNVEGITHEIDYQDDQAVESLTIDFENVSPEQVNELPGGVFDGEEGDFVSLEKSIEYLEQSGFERVD